MTLRLCFVKLFCAEVDLQHSAIWMAGVYLMLLMQFFENKVAVELTRSEFVEAQEVGIMPSLLPCLICLLFFFENFAFLRKWGVGGGMAYQLLSISLSIFGLSVQMQIHCPVFMLEFNIKILYSNI